MVAQRIPEPRITKLNTSKQSVPTVESEGLLGTLDGETVVPASDLTFSSASSFVERKRRFRLPKIVLQDKKRPDFDVKSCIEIGRHIPQNDAEIHERELHCCPPCNPKDGKGSKYIVDRSDWTPLMKAEPGDLACFLAGCPPGVTCERHSERPLPANSQESRSNAQGMVDLEGVTRGLACDSSKAGWTVQSLKSKQRSPGGRGSDGYTTYSQPTPLKTPSQELGSGYDNEAQANGRMRSSFPWKSPQMSEQESSVTSGSDAFPHATKSMELISNKIQPLSTSIITNFSLGGIKPKARYTSAKEAIRKRRSETRSRGSAEVPKPLRVQQNHRFRSGSVARARQELQRRSKSEGPPSISQPPSRDSGSTWEDNKLSELLGPLGKDLVRSMEEIAQRGDNAANMRPSSKGKRRSMKVESRSTQPRESMASNNVVTDDTAPTEVFEEIFDNGIPSKTKIPGITRALTTISPFSSVSQSPVNQTGKPVAPGAISPPLLSGGSNMLAASHGLFKPATAESQPVNTALPLPPLLSSTITTLPPVLSPVPSTPEIIKSEEPNHSEVLKIISDRDRERAIANGTSHVEVGNTDQAQSSNTKNQTRIDESKETTEQFPVPTVQNLTNIRKAQDLVDGVRGRLQQAEVQMIQAMKQETSGNATTADKLLSTYSNVVSGVQDIQLSKQASITLQPESMLQTNESDLSRTMNAPASYHPPRFANPPSGLVPPAKNAPCPAVESQAPGAANDIGSPLSPAAELSLNAAYWGFVPVIKEAVQDIVEVAVRNAVNGTAIAAANAATVCKPAPEPQLPRQKSDTGLVRSSICVEPATSQRDSESTVVRTIPILKVDSNHVEQSTNYNSSPQKNSPTSKGSQRGSIASRGQENESSQASSHVPSIDLGTGYDQLGENLILSDPRKNFLVPDLILRAIETVPLDNCRPTTGGKPGWRLPTGWKKGAGPAYTPIPARRSSKNQAGRNKTPLSTEIKISPKTSVGPPESSGRRDVRGSHALCSISSRDSLEMAAGRDEIRPRDWDAKTSLLEQIGDIVTDPVDKIGCANTVHWLKELLSTNGPYEPQFTPLPLRMRKDARKTALNTILKSGRNSDQVEVDVLKGRPVAPVVAKPKTDAAKRDKRTDASEAFTQTINDLELLMNEALIIARQAADTPDAPYVLGNAARMLKSGRERSEEEMRARCQSRIRRDVPSVHESLRSLSDSESYMTEENESCPLRPPTPPPGVTRAITINSKSTLTKNPSGWPPTGRSSTPYPPNSQLPSNQSPARNSNESMDQIKSADPRSMPLETRIGDKRKRTASMPPGGRSITTNLGRPFHSKRGSDFDDSLAYSDFDMSEPPQFRTLEFNRGRSITLKTMSSGKSPLLLDPVKTDPVRFDNVSRDLGKIPLNTSGQPGTGGCTGPLPYFTPPDMSAKKCAKGHNDDDRQAVAAKLKSKSVPGKREVRDYIVEHFHPPITERESSLNLRQKVKLDQEKPRALSGVTGKTGMTYNWQNIDQSKIEPCPISAIRASTVCEENQQPGYAQSYDGSNISHEMDFNTGYAVRQRGGGGEPVKNQSGYELHDNPDPNLALTNRYGPRKSHPFNLRGMNHVSLKDHHLKGFSLARSHKKQKIARDWSPARKRFVAFVSCLSTALIGLLVGIYAGETPSIQYYIVDLHHYTVLGNVFFFIGLSIPTFFFWPLPLLHGRKPYILGSMSLAMPLLFPQALAVGQVRSPYVATWRVALILPRAAMGFCLGFANMNFKSMLTDVFGASLQSSNPHQEHADEYDVRRHGGGMGIWLGLWTWSALGSIGVGFMIGAFIINHHNPAWGFYISIVIIAFVMLLNVVVPETRRAAYRRSVVEVANADGKVSRRLGRGEVKMHMVHTGPKWWGEEFHYGVTLTIKMLRQPGFMVMAFYVAWIYGQMVLTILLLGALMSRDYKLKSPEVAATGTALPLGALLAIPFQKASIFSRARSKAPVSDDATLSHKKVHWSSHMIRRSIFILCLPFAGLGFTLSSGGPPTPFILPILFAGLIGFLSNLAMAECHGILMETFDTSDLQPGMTGRARGSAGNKKEAKRTNYSSFPRVQSAFAITQGLGYLIASAASGVGGALTRHVGAQDATGVMAGILLVLSLMLLAVLVRFTTVQIVPDSRVEEMERYHNANRTSRIRRQEGLEEEEPLRPIIIGNPHHHTRRMCLLELGGLSRFSEIRIKNKLVDSNSLEAKHPNRAAFMSFEKRIKEKEEEIVDHVRRSLSRHSSGASRRSDPPELGDLGGFREMGEVISRKRSGNGRGSKKERVRRISE